MEIEEQDLSQAIEKSLFSKFRYLPKLLQFPTITVDEDLTLINSNSTTSIFNIVCDAKFKSEDAEERAKNVCDFFKTHALPFAWWIGSSGTPANLDQILINLGLQLESREVAMARKASQLTPYQRSPDLALAIVENFPSLEGFAKVLAAYDPIAAKIYKKIPLYRLLEEKKQLLCVGFHEKQPVVTGSLFFQEGIACICDILTDPQHRRKGYGTLMMHYLMNEAVNRHADLITLSASSEEGARIYERLGFKVCSSFEVYEYVVA